IRIHKSQARSAGEGSSTPALAGTSGLSHFGQDTSPKRLRGGSAPVLAGASGLSHVSGAGEGSAGNPQSPSGSDCKAPVAGYNADFESLAGTPDAGASEVAGGRILSCIRPLRMGQRQGVLHG